MGIKRTSTSTTNKGATRLIIATLLFGLQLAYARTAWSSALPATIRDVVVRLGTPYNNNLADVERLAKTPYLSVGLLISQLHTVAHPDRTITGYGSTSFNHLVWVEAALRYVTGGMDFCAPTKRKFANSGEQAIRSYWLHFANKSCVTFFAVWPSRGRYYVAPLDAQHEIINAWRQWYAAKGKTFKYVPLTDPKPWQWLEGVEKPVIVAPSPGPLTKEK